MASLNTIKNWFKTGLKPTQKQFWDTWDSFWHKDENIPVSNIEGIDNLLNQKANKSVLDDHLDSQNAHDELFNSKANKQELDNHLEDVEAHANLFATIRIIPHGKRLVFEKEGKINPGTLAEGDFCMGFVENQFINADYLGGDENSLTSYDV